MKLVRIFLTCAFLVPLSWSAPLTGLPVRIPADVLSTLDKSHPRLLASAADFERLRALVKTNDTARKWKEKIESEAVKLLNDPPAKYEIPDGLRLLATSRKILYRTYTLALAYRLEGSQRFLDRAWLELNNAAQYKDWNPKHFLDTAEMTHAFAIGYDWLYDQLSAEQRSVLREAMIDKGIKLAIQIHEEERWWARARHNWNQVCNGGIGMGALALADTDPELAGKFLRAALESIQLAMTEYGPDGAWAEGPGYWNYATTYNVTFLAALQTALKTDFGLSGIPGFSLAGMFPIYTTGPLGRTFNYADGGDGLIRSPSLFWLAKEFHQPAYAACELEAASPSAMDLVWFDPSVRADALRALPLDRYFRHAEIVTMRSAWGDRDALFAGFKAGDNKANHSNLDLGSFVFDALGKRWAVDLGADNYNLPGYFGKQRWTYYRMRAEGHNTLVLNPGSGNDQDPAASAKIVKFTSNAQGAAAVADLTAAYGKDASQVMRGLALLDRKRLLIQDEIQSEKPLDIRWFLHTPAEVEIDSSGAWATLKLGDARMKARILAPEHAAFTLMKAEPLPGSPHPEGQNSNAGVRKLGVQLKGSGTTKIAVLLAPILNPTEEPAPELKPLAAW